LLQLYRLLRLSALAQGGTNQGAVDAVDAADADESATVRLS